jgi:hypothetical protein
VADTRRANSSGIPSAPSGRPWPEHADDAGDDLTSKVRGYEFFGRRRDHPESCRQFVRSAIDVVAPGAHDFLGAFERPQHQPSQHHRAERMQGEFEGRDDAEGAAATSDALEEIRVFLWTGRDDPPIRQDDFG